MVLTYRNPVVRKKKSKDGEETKAGEIVDRDVKLKILETKQHFKIIKEVSG